MDRWAAILKQVNPEIGANVDRALGEWTRRLWERFSEWKEVGLGMGWEEWVRVREGVDGSSREFVDEQRARNG